MEKKILILIDIQNDYFPGGKMELVDMEKASKNAQILISDFRKKNLPVVFIKHLAIRANASFFIPGTVGAELHESICPVEGETVIIKNYPNSFRNTSLHEHLKTLQVNELVICGAMSHMCIDTTVRAAFDLGYSSTVISDACATRDLVFNEEKVEAAKVQLAYMAALNGTFASVTTTKKYFETSVK